MYYLYIIKQEKKLYVGITKNLDCRLKQHRFGHGAEYTRNFSSAELVYSEVFKSRSSAEKREQQIKRWSRAKKEALINQDFLLLQRLSRGKYPEFVEDISGSEKMVR